MAQIDLHADGYSLTVTYLSLLPYKKPEWTEKSMHDVSTSSQRSERRMRMTYTYARVQQIFTIANFPSCWSYPINLLMHIKETDEVEAGCLQT